MIAVGNTTLKWESLLTQRLHAPACGITDGRLQMQLALRTNFLAMTTQQIGMMLDELESALTSARSALQDFENAVDEEMNTSYQLELQEALRSSLETLASVKRTKSVPRVNEQRRDEEGFSWG